MAEIVEMMMFKNRNDRYKCAKDVLMDLKCIAKGEPPLLARERLNARLLTGLAEESSVSGQQITEGPIPSSNAVQSKTKTKRLRPRAGVPVTAKPPKKSSKTTQVLVLVLVISIVINAVLLIIRLFGRW